MNTKFNSEQIKKIVAWLQTGSINIFGLQFSGKDTQAQRLAELLGGQSLSGGDILRSSNRQDIIQHINKGNLAPTEEYLQLVLPFFGKEAFADKPLILSSVGRWYGEETGVVKAAETTNHPIRAVIYLDISEKEVWRRWEVAQELKDRGQRGDEDAEALKKRLTEFREKTLPVIDFYRQKSLLIEINGNAPQEEVTAEILKRLAERARLSLS